MSAEPTTWGVPALGSIDNLPRLIDEHRVDLVIITLPWNVQRKILAIVRECERQQVKVRTVPDLFELSLSQVQVEMLGGVPMLGLNEEARFNTSSRITKRMVDIVLALVALLPSALVTLVIAIAIRLDTPGPIFFAQERVGLEGRRFKVYKFRSMVVDAEKMHADLIRRTGEDPRHPCWPTTRHHPCKPLDRRFSLTKCRNLEHPARRYELVGARPTPDEVALRVVALAAVARAARPDRAVAGHGRSEVPAKCACWTSTTSRIGRSA